jgi:GGDEF domain-containing protein
LVQIQTGLTEFSGLPDRPLGFSIGIAIVDPRKTDGVDELIERADRQMYLAKFSGKGRVSVEEVREQP